MVRKGSKHSEPERSTREATRTKRSGDSVAQNPRYGHLPQYAAQAGCIGGSGKKRRRLTPHQYAQRQKSTGAAAVVLLFAHKGVVRPSEWTALLSGGNVALLIYSTVPLPPALEPYRYPKDRVTAWEDFTLFSVLCDLLHYAADVYKEANVFYTASGDSIPLVSAELLADPWRPLGLTEGTSVTGIGVTDVRPDVQAFEDARCAALSKFDLPPMPGRCYGSQWVMLTREHAALVVETGSRLQDKLKGIYNEAVALPQDGHTKRHARFHPDEEYAPYILHVLNQVPWPTAFAEIMDEKPTDEKCCNLCRYRVGHASVLNKKVEEQRKAALARRGRVRLFMRKVQRV
jgi:hypothetical protein